MSGMAILDLGQLCAYRAVSIASIGQSDSHFIYLRPISIYLENNITDTKITEYFIPDYNSEVTTNSSPPGLIQTNEHHYAEATCCLVFY